jgi:hypothetical protein
LYDNNLQLKVDLHQTREDNTRLKTRMSQMAQQLKGRDKLIDELYKSAYITANGQQASHNLPATRDALMLVSLQREVQTLKDTLYEREDQLAQLKMDQKYTKQQELEAELQVYQGECLRLRGMLQQAIEQSGELDLKRLRKQSELQIREYRDLAEQIRVDLEEQTHQTRKYQ